jgi:hypothetical protein
MADQDFVDSVLQKIKEGDVGVNRPVSEAILQKVAGSINALIDNGKVFTFCGNGYFKPTTITTAIDGVVHLDREYTITQYVLTCDRVADLAGDGFRINVGIYDNNDVFVQNLFGSGVDGLLMQASSPVSGPVIGRDVVNSQIIDEATTGLTLKYYGTLNTTTLQAGYKLRCFIENGGGNSRNFRFSIKVS